MIFDYQKKGHRTNYISEPYVSSPPAAFIVNEYGDMFTLGFESLRSQDCPNGEYAFDILKNGYPTGEYASRIERRNGKVRIFTRKGWKVYNGRSFL
jgi:hypothetical protein